MLLGLEQRVFVSGCLPSSSSGGIRPSNASDMNTSATWSRTRITAISPSRLLWWNLFMHTSSLPRYSASISAIFILEVQVLVLVVNFMGWKVGSDRLCILLDTHAQGGFFFLGIWGFIDQVWILYTKDQMDMDMVRALANETMMDHMHWRLASCSRIVFDRRK